MSDQWDDHGEADGLLDALLFAHTRRLRDAIGDALDVDSGLANLRPLREPVRQTGENSGGGESAAVRAAPARRTNIAGEGTAVERLVATLRHEKRQVAGLRERFQAVGPTGFSAVRSRHISNSLLTYGSYLGGLAEDFGSRRGSMDRDTVLHGLTTHQQRLGGIRVQFAGAAAGTDQQTQGEWKVLVLLVEERADVLLDLRGTIEWLFEDSDSLQEVNS
ncbi:hypothetical protein [Streptomyces sp. NPDC002209]|uniref:hypothetical protein n=1 Tax=Streptomyces sp. NPDC002209 TaxID=3364638 RepID=UPI00367632DF